MRLTRESLEPWCPAQASKFRRKMLNSCKTLKKIPDQNPDKFSKGMILHDQSLLLCDCCHAKFFHEIVLNAFKYARFYQRSTDIP